MEKNATITSYKFSAQHRDYYRIQDRFNIWMSQRGVTGCVLIWWNNDIQVVISETSLANPLVTLKAVIEGIMLGLGDC